MLQATGLGCQRSRRRLFSDLSISLAGGELLHVRGANGSGKSTLLRILMGLYTDFEGEVEWHLERAPLYIGHKTAVNLRLTVEENTQWLCRVQDVNASSSDIDRVLAEIGLAGYQKTPCGRLSEGQRKRVGLARFFLCKNPCWIMDEPFSAIDTSGLSFLYHAVEAHVGQGGSAILTSHQELTLDLPFKRLELTS